MHPQLARLFARCGIDPAAGPPSPDSWRALIGALRAEGAPGAAADSATVLAAASHDVRTPLNELLGLAQLLQNCKLPPEQAGYVADLGRAAEQVLGIVDELLDFAALQSGELRLEPVAFDPRQLVAAAVGQLPASRPELRIDDAVPAELVGDAERIRQVLVHALGAGLARAAGPTRLAVRVQEREEGPQLSFELRGDRAPHADAALSAAGLSRAVGERLVALLGGTLEIPLLPDGGPLVCVRVRCGRVEAAAVGDDELRGLVVLLAHGDAARLAELERRVAGWGARPLVARDAASALSALQHSVHGGTPADLGVIDVQLPGADGLELARRVRSDPLLAAMPLVLLEGTPASDARATAAAGLFDARLEREPDAAALGACLARLYQTPHAELLQRRRRSGAPAPASRPSSAPAAPAPARAAGKVLVVEDVASNALVARRMLERAGLTVTTCSNGAEALEALARERFEIALVDCEMPVLDGYEATREIRRREEGSSRHQVIIALTANALAGDRKRCLDAGMDDYVAKPLKADDLLRLIDEWLPWALARNDQERAVRT
jgi:CheY-like chemotaxis protein